MELSSEQRFGELLWELITSKQFGAPSKRELELTILQAAADADLIDETQPSQVSAVLRLSSITKAHSYLADLSQRRPPLQDMEALRLLADLLKRVEVLPIDKHLSIPLQRADLRIWLERKLAADGLHPGESLRRDLAKITPLSLLRLLDNTSKLQKPAAALKRLNHTLGEPSWVAIAQQEWSANTTWADTVNTFGTLVSIASALPTLIRMACGG
jgi:hypothetical protein